MSDYFDKHPEFFAEQKAEFFNYLNQNLQFYFNHNSEHIKFCLYKKRQDDFTYLRVTMAFTSREFLIPIYFINEFKPIFVVNGYYMNRVYKKETFMRLYNNMARRFLINNFLYGNRTEI